MKNETKKEVILERCPVCHHAPTVQINDTTLAVTFLCEQHGYEMGGDTMESAVTNWNYVVEFIRKAA